MVLYIILTRFSSGAFEHPRDLKLMTDKVMKQIKQQCPEVSWIHSYATNGRFDVVNIVESDEWIQVMKAAAIIKSFGNSNTETMEAIPWNTFLDSL